MTSELGPVETRLPFPDPTQQTTDQLRHELAGLKELFQTQLTAMDTARDSLRLFGIEYADRVRGVIETRLDGMDRASVILSDNLYRVPTVLDREISKVNLLFSEKFVSIGVLFNEKFASLQVQFNSINTQFHERDIRTKASELASTVAVGAALQAQKEAAAAQNDSNAVAVKKSEDAVVKQIDGILALMTSNTRAIDEKIAGLSSRLDRGDGGVAGRASMSNNNYSAISLVIAIVAVAFSGFMALHTEQPPIVVNQQQPAAQGSVFK
jgi:hypothetical protein